MDKEQKIKKIAEKIKGMRTTMLVTVADGGMHMGRPMATQDVEFDGSVWFMTSKDSKKIAHIRANPSVGLMYGDGSIQFVSLSGTAELSEDRAKIKEFWNEFYKAWFENEDDPNIILIKVNVNHAEYWDHAGGKLGAYADMAASVVMGKTMEGQNEAFDL